MGRRSAPSLWREEWKPLVAMAALFGVLYWLPTESPRLQAGLVESLALARWYAREHVLLCLVPAFFIAGAITVFLNQQAVLRYLGPTAPKVVAYGVASVAGTILAVCSCTVLPLFAGIYAMGAGLGPASAFLYSGPAINVLAIILTARILGLQLGVARALGAVLFAVVIGLLMHLLFRREDQARAALQGPTDPGLDESRPLRQTAVYFALLVGILVFANWGRPPTQEGFWFVVYQARWWLTATLGLGLGLVLVAWFGLGWARFAAVVVPTAGSALAFPGHPAVPFVVAFVAISWVLASDEGELGQWLRASWGYAKQIVPLLFAGILVAGLLLGRPGQEGLIPSHWISQAVGGNSLGANLFAAAAGAFMYFATLTEVPILQGLMGNGMGNGPALALLLAGPAVSLPSLLVIRSVLGTKKTLAFLALVMVMSTAVGLLYGALASS